MLHLRWSKIEDSKKVQGRCWIQFSFSIFGDYFMSFCLTQLNHYLASWLLYRQAIYALYASFQHTAYTSLETHIKTNFSSIFSSKEDDHDKRSRNHLTLIQIREGSWNTNRRDNPFYSMCMRNPTDNHPSQDKRDRTSRRLPIPNDLPLCLSSQLWIIYQETLSSFKAKNTRVANIGKPDFSF